MAILRNPLVWQGLFAAVFLGFMAVDVPWLRAVVPVLAVAAWIYIGYRLFAERQAMRVVETPQPAPIDRSTPLPPRIKGEVVAPEVGPAVDITEMAGYLGDRLIGQDVVASQIARGVFRRMAQERRDKPVFTALLSGPTGTGKTEMAKAVASYLYGDDNALFRIDCGNVLGEAGLQTLIGSPKGYAGSGSWGALTSQLRSTPRTVLLFDEIEKAVTSPTAPMAKLMLSLLDEGICTEQSDGTKVSARDAVIIMTSNAAHQKLGPIAERYADEPDELIRATKDALRDHFAPEFLARIDLVTSLAPLDDPGRARIIALHAGRIGRTYGVEVDSIDASFVSEGLRRWAALEGYGTREVIRWIEEVSADKLIEAKSQGLTKVGLTWADGQVEVTRP